MRSDARPWWLDAIGYEIYLPSFCDSDGDGWGDLTGVRARLDYLAELGVDLLWITPFFRSPMRDHGYDVSDHRAVDRTFGSQEDLDSLLSDAHRRGMKVIADLVVNHTSDQHPWFQAARANRHTPYRDYYVWHPPGPGGVPPNNWVSHFGGPAWSLDPITNEYYLHLFTPHQPDLNWRSAAVAEEVDDIIEFWLRRGLDGFRIDTAHYLTKADGFPDNPLLGDDQVPRLGGATDEWLRQEHRHDIGQASVLEIHRRWRRIADRFGAFLVGEIYELDPLRLARYVAEDGLHSAFWFGLVEHRSVDAEPIATMLAAAASASPRLSWALSNHDRQRAVTRFEGGELGRRRALALMTLMMGLPGTPFLYQGEELGLDDGNVAPHLVQDPLGSIGSGHSGRDGARTPIPWAAGPGMGFTSATDPWLPFGGRSTADTAETQASDPRSYLSAVRSLCAARRRIPPFEERPLRWLRAEAGVIAYERANAIVVANLGDQTRPLPRGINRRVYRPAFHTHARQLVRVPATIGPYEAMMLLTR